MLTVDHRVRSRSLLREVDNCLGGEFADGLLDEHVVGEVADERLDDAARDLLPGRDPPLQLPDGHETVDAHLAVVQASGEIVDNAHVVIARGQVQRGRPAKITVATEYEDPHRSFFSLSIADRYAAQLA